LTGPTASLHFPRIRICRICFGCPIEAASGRCDSNDRSALRGCSSTKCKPRLLSTAICIEEPRRVSRDCTPEAIGPFQLGQRHSEAGFGTSAVQSFRKHTISSLHHHGKRRGDFRAGDLGLNCGRWGPGAAPLMGGIRQNGVSGFLRIEEALCRSRRSRAASSMGRSMLVPGRIRKD
jgi:hypothetical protein